MTEIYELYVCELGGNCLDILGGSTLAVGASTAPFSVPFGTWSVLGIVEDNACFENAYTEITVEGTYYADFFSFPYSWGGVQCNP